MKKTVSTLLFLFFLTFTYAQKTEYGISLNSGLFSFAGDLAQTTTFISYNTTTNLAYTINPLGSKSGLSYGISANLKQITKKNLVLGFDFGYEILRSKISINSVWISDETSASVYYDATGQTFLNNEFINLFPQIGYRFNTKKFYFDLVLGSDIAFCLNTTEKGDATASNGIRYTTSGDRETIKKDFRPRIQLSAYYNKAGIYAGYSFGLTNHTADFLWSAPNFGSPTETNSRLFRFGLTYRLK